MVNPVQSFSDTTWIVTTALTHIGAISIDNPADPEDVALATNRLNSVCAELAEKGVYYVGDMDMVPAGAARQIAYFLALALQPDFGDMAPPGSASIPSFAEIEDALRRMSPGKPGYGPQQVSFM